ncbi:DUF6965 family protein [Paenimyroides ceti]
MKPTKKQWLEKSIQEINSKNLKEPIQLNQCTTIIDLKLYLKTISSSILETKNENILRILIAKIEELKKI